MASIFTKIIDRRIPAYILAEDAKYIAFLDIAPIAKGHTLVVPKTAVDYIFDLSDTALAGLLCFAKKVAKGMAQVLTCRRIGVLVLGLEVPHAHLHLVPIQEEKDLNLSNPKMVLSPAEMASIAQSIHQALSTIG